MALKTSFFPLFFTINNFRVFKINISEVEKSIITREFFTIVMIKKARIFIVRKDKKILIG